MSRVEERVNCEHGVRKVYRQFEQGRLYELMDRLHNMLCRLDPDELEQFKKDFSCIVPLVNEFAVIEELREI